MTEVNTVQDTEFVGLVEISNFTFGKFAAAKSEFAKLILYFLFV